MKPYKHNKHTTFKRTVHDNLQWEVKSKFMLSLFSLVVAEPSMLYQGFAPIGLFRAYWSNCRNKSTLSSSNAGHSASHASVAIMKSPLKIRRSLASATTHRTSAPSFLKILKSSSISESLGNNGD